MTPSAELEQAGALTAEGMRLHEQGRVEEARARYRKALVFAPDHLAAVHLLALAEAQGGDLVQAAELFEKVLSLSADDPVVHSNYASLLWTIGDSAQALTEIGRAHV